MIAESRVYKNENNNDNNYQMNMIPQNNNSFGNNNLNTNNYSNFSYNNNMMNHPNMSQQSYGYTMPFNNQSLNYSQNTYNQSTNTDKNKTSKKVDILTILKGIDNSISLQLKNLIGEFKQDINKNQELILSKLDTILKKYSNQKKTKIGKNPIIIKEKNNSKIKDICERIHEVKILLKKKETLSKNINLNDLQLKNIMDKNLNDVKILNDIIYN